MICVPSPAHPTHLQAAPNRRSGTRSASAPITVSDWQTVGVEPVAGVTAAGRGGRADQRGRYGIDGGYAGLALFGAMEAGLAGAVAWAARRRRPAVAALAGAGGAAVAGSAASYLYSTGPGKRAIWAPLLDDLGLRGDEHVLGRRVRPRRGADAGGPPVAGGGAVGADVWRRRDQSGNSRAAAERNAVAEGVRGQVELADADARDLPFASASFDVVVSSLAISNIRDAGGRAQALREAVRVLRPGGRLRIVDQGADRYAAVLRESRLPAWPYGSSTGGPGTACQDITSPWSQPPGHPADARQAPGTRRYARPCRSHSVGTGRWITGWYGRHAATMASQKKACA